MILSQNNWDYNKHFQVVFDAYVQASQVNDSKNTNNLKTVDGIYLCPVNNLQGGHQIMDLFVVQFVKITKVVNILIIYVMINDVEKWRRSRDLSC